MPPYAYIHTNSLIELSPLQSWNTNMYRVSQAFPGPFYAALFYCHLTLKIPECKIVISVNKKDFQINYDSPYSNIYQSLRLNTRDTLDIRQFEILHCSFKTKTLFAEKLIKAMKMLVILALKFITRCVTYSQTVSTRINMIKRGS